MIFQKPLSRKELHLVAFGAYSVRECEEVSQWYFSKFLSSYYKNFLMNFAIFVTGVSGIWGCRFKF
jgi:hypothetical protein